MTATGAGTILLNLDPRLEKVLAQRGAGVPLELDLLDERQCAALLTGVDRIVIDPLLHGASPQTQLLHSSLGIWNLLRAAPRAAIVQLSSMRLMDDHDPGWLVSERFVALPADDHSQLCHYLAELTSREASRELESTVRVLRLDDLTGVVAPGPTQIHVEDAATAVVRALDPDTRDPWFGRWTVLHIVHGQGRHPLVWASRSPFAFQPAYRGDRMPDRRPPEPAPAYACPEPVGADDAIAVLGAGGPLGARVAAELAVDHPLVLVDRDPLRLSAQRSPQSPGAPLPRPLPPPHRHVEADIADLESMTRVLAGAKALVNTAVVREDPAVAFRVNVVGAWVACEAARRAGVQRLVHCGPTQGIRSHPIGNYEDARVPDDAPARPGGYLYFLTKFLGQEIVATAARHRGWAAPILHLDIMMDPHTAWPDQQSAYMISWADAARAVRAALEVDDLPEPAPIIGIHAPGPHGRLAPSRAADLLHWHPDDDLSQQWWHPELRGSAAPQ